jgi:hypothetical protein
MSDSNNIAKIYLKRINHHIKGKELEQELFKACSNIIYCILNKRTIDADSYFNFSSLLKMSKLNNDQRKTFAESIYVLAHPNIDFVEQKFQYEAEDGFWHDLDLDIIYVSFRDNVFYHPVKQVQINKSEFNDVVLPYFTPSVELLKLVGAE